jgi:hypothetical protein
LAPSEPSAHPLEPPQRLSRSLIWGLQRSFYSAQGPDAWKPGVVPSYPTNNPVFARTYARLVIAFLRDLAAAEALDRDHPVYLVELAAGSGQFAYLFLKHFDDQRRGVPALEGLRLVYVMTDLAESNLLAWAAHDKLGALLEEGRLDFARFDFEQDEALVLQRSGATLAAGSVRNPVLAVANYAFDTSRQDGFWVEGGELQEARVSAVSSQATPDPAAPDILAHVSLRWEPAPCALPYYQEPALDAILERYRERLGDTFFLVPLAAFRAAAVLAALAGGKLLLLCGDKAFTYEEEWRGLREPPLKLHGASFSMQVNLHALGLWFEAGGGSVLHHVPRGLNLRVSVLQRGVPGLELRETTLAFRETLGGFAPQDGQVLLKALADEHPKPSLDVILALLRLCYWDPEIIFAYAQPRVEAAKTATPAQVTEVMAAVRKVAAMFYPMTRDLPYELGRISMAYKHPKEAAALLTESLRLYGPQATNLMVLGMASAMLGQDKPALVFLERSLAMQPDNAAARALRDALVMRVRAAGG